MNRKFCEKCRKTFTPKNNTQKYCLNPCRSRVGMTIAEANANWIERDAETEHRRRYRNNKENFGYLRVI